MTSIAYSSHQDFATRMARITTITMRGNLAWKYQNYRTDYNQQDADFRMHLHEAMGWKPSTVQDWA